jgi:hypothetical protein
MEKLGLKLRMVLYLQFQGLLSEYHDKYPEKPGPPARLEAWTEVFEEYRIDTIHPDDEKAAKRRFDGEFGSVSDALSEPETDAGVLWDDGMV